MKLQLLQQIEHPDDLSVLFSTRRERIKVRKGITQKGVKCSMPNLIAFKQNLLIIMFLYETMSRLRFQVFVCTNVEVFPKR